MTDVEGKKVRREENRPKTEGRVRVVWSIRWRLEKQKGEPVRRKNESAMG